MRLRSGATPRRRKTQGNAHQERLDPYQIMNAIRKDRVKNISKGDILGQRDFIHSLFGINDSIVGSCIVLVI